MRRRLSLWLTLYFLLVFMGPTFAAESPRLLVGGDHNFPPYQFLDADGNPAGFDIDILYAVSEVMGLKPEIRLRPWDEVRGDLEQGRLDAVPGMVFSAERDRLLDFSMPIQTIRYAIFVRKGTAIHSLHDLQGKGVIVQRGDIMHDYALANNLATNVVLAETQIEALRLLASRKHDAVLTSLLQGRYLLHKYKLTNIEAVGKLMPSVNSCFAVAEGNSELLAILNEGLSIIRATGRYDEIYRRWFGVYEQNDAARPILLYGAWGGAVLVLLLGAAFIWSWSVKRQIAMKTGQFRDELLGRGQIELELMREKRFRQLVDAAPVPMGVISKEQKILYLNEKFTELFGYTQSDLPHVDAWWTRAYPDAEYRRQVMSEWNERVISKLGKGASIAPLDRQVVCKDGSLRYAVFLFSADEDRIYMTASDVTDRKSAELALYRSEARLKGIFNNVAAGIEALDAEGRFVDVNDRLTQMLGCSREELIGKSPLDFTHPDDLETSREFLHKALRGDLNNYRREKRYVRKDGSFFWADLAFTQIRDKAGNIEADIGIIFDISERKAIEDELREANRELEAFAYTVSHDLRSPLSPVIGYAEFLRDNYSEQLDDAALEMLAEIIKSGKRMLDLMEDLLRLALVGYLPRPSQPVDVTAVVREMSLILEAANAPAKTAVQWGDLPTLHVPATLLSQVFENLIGNALRYAAVSDEPIVVEGSRSGERVRFCVRDRGEGIPPEERERVFDLFYRGSTGKQLKGTGVGLATVQKIARLYGGRAWAEETPGGGATLCFEVEDVVGEGERSFR